MMFTTRTGTDKRRALRQMLAEDKLCRFPGAFNPLCAQLIERKGFEGVYASGAVISADLCLPDIGIANQNEFLTRGSQIARASDAPTIIDIDTGFGEPMSAARTVRLMEEAGLAGCHIEDQQAPKRCGHLEGKELVEIPDMLRRIKAAISGRLDNNFVIIARTDARAVEGLPAAIDRMKAYVDAGADAIFPEALESKDEFALVRKTLSVPLLANMTEFGRSPLLTHKELTDLGYNIVIYPVTTLRLAMRAAERGLDHLLAVGDQNDLIDLMQHRRELYDLLSYKEYAKFDDTLFRFTV